MTAMNERFHLKHTVSSLAKVYSRIFLRVSQSICMSMCGMCMNDWASQILTGLEIQKSSRNIECSIVNVTAQWRWWRWWENCNAMYFDLSTKESGQQRQGDRDRKTIAGWTSQVALANLWILNWALVVAMLKMCERGSMLLLLLVVLLLLLLSLNYFRTMKFSAKIGTFGWMFALSIRQIDMPHSRTWVDHVNEINIAFWRVGVI